MPSVAIVGSGSAAAVWAQALRSSTRHQLVGIGSRHPANAARLAGGYDVDVLEGQDLYDRPEVLVVASAPAAHLDHVRGAVDAGRGVIVEAPLCSTLAEADELVALAEAGARLAPAEHLLFAPLVRDAIARVSQLGPLHLLDGRMLVPAPVRRSPLSPSWGGGVLFDAGPHPLAVLLAMAGADRPVSVSARLEPDPAPAASGIGIGSEIDVSAHVSLTLASGARAALHLGWRSPQAQWDLQVSTPSSTLRLELLPDPHLEQLGVDLPRPPRREPPVEPPQLELFGYLDQLDEVVDDLASGRRPWIDAGFARSLLDVICAAYRSAGTGRPEPLPFQGDRHATPWQLWQAGERERRDEPDGQGGHDAGSTRR